MGIVNIKIKKMYILSLLALSLISSVLSFSTALASFEGIPNRIPDDNYLIRDPDGNAQFSSDYCAARSFQTGSPFCIADMRTPQDSHQYLTLGGSSINDSVGGSYRYARGMDLVVYKQAPLRDQQVRIDFINRGISNALACEGYIINATIEDGDGNAVTGVSGSRSAPGTCGDGRRYPLVRIPDYAFRMIREYNPVTRQVEDTGVYRAYLRVGFDANGDNRRQASFHLSVDSADGGKIGYRRTVESDKWVNTYPTAIARGHTIEFKFRPPCGTSAGTPIQIAWDEGNEGTPLQPSSEDSRVRIIRVNEETGSRAEIGNRPLGSGPQYWTFANQTYDNQPYSYSIEFTKINGGNGISFSYPYDSGSFWLKCPTAPSTWRLGNRPSYRDKSGVGVDIITVARPSTAEPNRPITPPDRPTYRTGMNCSLPTGYPASSDRNSRINKCRWLNYDAAAANARTTNESRVRAALGSVNFWHRVYNQDANGGINHGAAPNRGHWTKIQYMYDLVGGRGSTGYLDRYSGSRNSTDIAPSSSWQPFSTDRPALSSTRSEAREMFQNPRYGDRYCEQAVTEEYPTSSGGRDITSGGICVSLQPTTTECSPSWFINVDGTIRRNGSSIGRTDGSAEVGSSYAYHALAFNNGPGTANTGLTVGNDINSPWGGWNPRGVTIGNRAYSDTHLATHTVQPSEGGATVPVQFRYSPTYYDNTSCSGGGSEQVNLSIYIPWYYHLRPSITQINNTTPQGNGIAAVTQILNPDRDNDPALKQPQDNENGGRRHTYSRPTEWRVTEFKTNNAAAAESAVAQNSEGTGGPCADLGNFGVPSLSGCTTVSSGTDTIQIESRNLPSYSRPAQIEPVGTVICYVLGLLQPSHIDNGVWRYSQASCTTVVKPPKVRFENSDLNVGRGIPSTADPTSCTPNSSAQIRAAGVQDYVINNGLPQQNLYGSWVEYSVFARSNISSFGSAATPTPLTGNNKLSFRNNPTPYGNFNYARQCTDNFMSNLWQSRDTTTNPAESITLPDPNLGSITAVRWDQAAYSSATPPTKTSFKSSSTVSISNPTPPPLPAPSTVIVNASGQPNSPDSARPQMRVTVKPRTGGSCIDSAGAPMTGGELNLYRTLGVRNSSDASAAPLNTNTSYGYEFTNLQLGSCGPEYVRVVLLNDYDTTTPSSGLGPGPFPAPVSQDSTLRVTSIRVNSRTYNSGNTTYDDRTTTPGRYTAWPRREGTLCANPDTPGNNSYWSRPAGTLAQWLGGEDKRTKTGNWSGINNPQTNICSGMELFVDAAAGAQPDTIAPSLDRSAGESSGLAGKDVVVYAQKTSPGACNPGDGSGYIRIRKNIEYPDLLDEVGKIPRIILLADCGITIDSAVSRVDAWMITKGVLSTCDAIAGSVYPQLIQNSTNVTNTQLSKTDCNGSPDNTLAGATLTTNGPIVAKTWRLWRTWGGDLEGSSGNAVNVAESFIMRPDQLISTYNYGVKQGKQEPVQEINLPPRY